MKKYLVGVCYGGITHRIIQGCIHVISLNKDDAGTLAEIIIKEPIQILNITEIGYL